MLLLLEVFVAPGAGAVLLGSGRVVLQKHNGNPNLVDPHGALAEDGQLIVPGLLLLSLDPVLGIIL